ncbi:MAG: hypothetical protein INF43_04065 [Alphaproteobacteria bacterium]|nr:hypothetical protein [Alphaproteobacteria bacterium]
MESPTPPSRAAAVLAEVDEAMWLRAREGDVAAAKLVYARLAQLLPPPAPPLPPTWAELQTLINHVQQQQKELAHGLLDDTAKLGAGPPR